MKMLRSVIFACTSIVNNSEKFKKIQIWDEIWSNRYVHDICHYEWIDMIHIENKTAVGIEYFDIILNQ